jgi:hypothetical protein
VARKALRVRSGTSAASKFMRTKLRGRRRYGTGLAVAAAKREINALTLIEAGLCHTAARGVGRSLFYSRVRSLLCPDPLSRSYKLGRKEPWLLPPGLFVYEQRASAATANPRAFL